MSELRLVHAENYLVRSTLARANANVDRHGLDHSRHVNAILPRWSEEAMAREPKWELIRQDTTLAERVDAWRQLFKKAAR